MIPIVTVFGQLGMLTVCCRGDGESEAFSCIINAMPYVSAALTHSREWEICVPHKEECIAFYNGAKDILRGGPYKHMHVSLMNFFWDLRKSCTECGAGLRDPST